MASNKSGVILDVPAICELAASAAGFRDELTEMLDKISAQIKDLHSDSIDGLSGGQGDAVNAALDDITQLCDEIKHICARICKIATDKATKMNEQYKDKGGADQAARIAAQKNAIKRT